MLILAIALALSLDGLVAGAALGLRGVKIGSCASVAIALLSAGLAALSISAGAGLSQISPRLGTLLGAGILMLLGSASLVKAFRKKRGTEEKVMSPSAGKCAGKNARVASPDSNSADSEPPSENERTSAEVADNSKKRGTAEKVMSPSGSSGANEKVTSPAGCGRTKAKREPRPKRFHLLGLTILVIREPSEGDLDHSGRIEFVEAILLGLSLSVDMLGAGIGLGLTGISPVWLPLAVGAMQTVCLGAGGELGRRLHRLPLGERVFGALAGTLLLALGIVRLAF